MYAVLLAPSGNRVYAGEAERIGAAELEILLAAAGCPATVTPTRIAGIAYLQVDLPTLPPGAAGAIGLSSGLFAAYEQEAGDLLRPVRITRPDRFEDDLVSIPKYPGKTNEQFTRLLTNVTIAAVRRPGPLTLLDPLCGRGTTLSTGLILGHRVCGVEADERAIEAYAAFLRTYLRRKRISHTVEWNPVRREGRTLGRRLEARITPETRSELLTLTVLTGDGRDSAALYGKRRFDAVITDAPYGVVHGAHSDELGRERSAAGLLAAAVPVWAGQLRTGGALGIAWNTLNLSRGALRDLVRAAGLRALDEGPYARLAHRVDSSIHRDVLVAVRETAAPAPSI